MHTSIHTSMQCAWQPAEGCLRPATHFPLYHTGSDPRTDHPKPSIRAAAHAAMKWPAVGGQAARNAIGPSGSIPMHVCYSATLSFTLPLPADVCTTVLLLTSIVRVIVVVVIVVIVVKIRRDFGLEACVKKP